MRSPRYVYGVVFLVVTILLAGCTASSGADLSVDRFVFAASEPSPDAVEPQPDGTYAPGDRVWLFLDVRGVAPRDTGDGRDVTVVQNVSVTGPGGEVLVRQDGMEQSMSFTEDRNLSTFYIHNSFPLPIDAAAGEYTVDVGLRDAESGATVTRSESFTVDPNQEPQDASSARFRLSGIDFASGPVQGFRQYREQPDDTYAPGDTMYTYTEMQGVSYEQVNESWKRLNLSKELIVFDRQENVLYQSEDRFDTSLTSDIDFRFVYEDVPLAERLPEGTYGVLVRLTDEIAGASVERAKQFTVEAGQ